MAEDRFLPIESPNRDTSLACPLCGWAGKHDMLRGADGRQFYHCGQCNLIFADPRHAISDVAAADHYKTHENHIGNDGYVQFLRRVIDSLLPFLQPEMKGLDYGCGPGPTLSVILRQHGLPCADYDPLFADGPLDPPYDFVFATECFEHFHRPAEEIERIASLLGPQGYLGVMTETWTDLNRFETWYYTRDPTHVSLFHERTFDEVCQRFGFSRLPCGDRRVFLFQRKDSIAAETQQRP